MVWPAIALMGCLHWAGPTAARRSGRRTRTHPILFQIELSTSNNRDRESQALETGNDAHLIGEYCHEPGLFSWIWPQDGSRLRQPSSLALAPAFALALALVFALAFALGFALAWDLAPG